MSIAHVIGLRHGADDDEDMARIGEAANMAFDGFSWLSPGESVWLKVALNSCDPHPATTDWRAVKAVANEIKDRGGIVVVADQSGIEYDDRATATVSATEYCYAHSGMSRCGENILALENRPFDIVNHPKAIHWPLGFRVTHLVQNVQHIINLPRLSMHGMAGTTLGAKNWVGALQREDRYRFHAQGPMYWFIQAAKVGSGEKLPPTDKRHHFFEMIAELALPFRGKLRGTLFAGRRVQMSLGPNKHLMSLCKTVGVFKSYVMEPDPGVVIAASDPVVADAAALAYLYCMWSEVPFSKKALQNLLTVVNGRIPMPDARPVKDDPVIARQISLGLGQLPTAIEGHDVPIHVVQGMGRRLGISV